MTKQEIRKVLLNLRNNIEDRDIKDKKICENFLNKFSNLTDVLIFIKTGSEVNTKYIVEILLKNGVNLYAPKCKDGKMNFYKFDNLNQLKIGEYGILEPTSNIKFCEKSAVCITPGLGFSLNGDRIGYGKGYYDKFFKENSVISVGLCYNIQIRSDIPVDLYDEKINILITEDFIKEVNNNG